MIHPDVRPILERMDHWGAELDALTRQYGEVREAAATIDEAYDVGFAEALARSKATNEAMRKAEALLASRHLLGPKMVSDAKLDVLRKKMSNAEKQLERCRSWNSAANTAARETGGRL